MKSKNNLTFRKGVFFMINKIKQEYIWALVSLSLFIVAVFSDGTIDIAVHDIYFVIQDALIFKIVGALFLLYSLVSFLFGSSNRSLNRSLFYWHYGLTLVSFLVFYGLLRFHFLVNQNELYEDYSVYTDETYKYGSKLIWAIFGSLIILVVSQLLFVLNCVKSMFRRK
jgi:hypothetical protein